MFYPTQGATKILVGESFPCYIPKIPPKELILFSNLPKEEQYWRRTPLPKYYIERVLEEEYKQKNELELVLTGQRKKVTYVDSVLERYRRQEWWRRVNGVWFMNEGEPTYITGHHYFYLQWSKFDHPSNEGYPNYYEFSRDNFYIRDWCENNPCSLGYIMIASRGTGKCLGKGTKVMMYEGGTKNAEDVVIGDLLMGPDSKPRKVLKLSSGVDDLYEVVQNYGISYVVNKNHVLSLKRNSGDSFLMKSGGPKRKGKSFPRFPQYNRIANIPITEFINKTKSFKNTFSGYKVGVNYERKDIKINPYFLGMWLGDGHSSGPMITSMDKEIVYWLEQFVESEKLILKKHNSSGQGLASTYSISSPGHRSSKNHLLDRLRDYDLIDNKHIPWAYLYNTREVRMKLLAGLIDTDGHFSKGRYELTQVRKRLAEQILILVRGLGFKSSIKEKVINGTAYYRVGFSGMSNIPVLLERKRNKNNPNKDPLITHIDEVNFLGKGEYFGFEVDKDHLFCLEDGTVTHNSSEELSVLINRTTMFHSHRAAIQGKHIDDVREKLFQAKLVPLFNTLPQFFKPEFSHGTDPKEAFTFSRPSVRGVGGRNVEFGPDLELKSTVFSAYPGEKVLDGDTLGDAYSSEVGKTDPNKVADVHVRHGVNLKAVFRNHVKIGLLREESTVEEMNEGGDECEKIWKDSDPLLLDGNGFTKSKIHRHFISALDTDTSIKPFSVSGQQYSPPCNKYGKVDRALAGIKIQADLDSVKDDLKELSSRMRKSPRNATEAFIKDQSKSVFNIQKLSNRLEEIRNKMHKKPYRTGNLYWLKEKFGPVGWTDDEHAGRFNWAWFPDEFSGIAEPGKWKILNNFKKEWGYNRAGRSKELVYPGNNHLFRIGTDPIKFTKTKDPRASKAAGHGFRLFDGLADYGKAEKDWESHNFIFEYIKRPDDPEVYFEDMAMAAMFLGCKILPERNVDTLNGYFKYNGLDWLLWYPKDDIANEILEDGESLSVQQNSDEGGLAQTTEVTNYYTMRLQQYINKHVHRCPFDNTIENWMNFDPLNPTIYDATVSSGMTLVHAEKKSEIERPSEGSINDWFDTYDNSGESGRFADVGNGLILR